MIGASNRVLAFSPVAVIKDSGGQHKQIRKREYFSSYFKGTVLQGREAKAA